MNHIDISRKNSVEGISSGTGMVERATWNPGKGRQEAEERAIANQRAYEQMIEAERLNANPELQRIEILESEVQELKSKLISFIELYGQK